ncbi:MAG TPA: hypothetical protein VFN67_39335 [Polyangiales bacterium]|jgi:hypothetical protein|nr:hypothetical protein [Polyangiales bacterium]
MSTFIATFVVLAFLMASMALGVVFSGRRLRGSCGGVPNTDCSCNMSERRACQRKAAAEGIVSADDHHHLTVVDDDVR